VGKGMSEEASWYGLRLGHVMTIIINITTKYYKGRERQVLLNNIMDLQKKKITSLQIPTQTNNIRGGTIVLSLYFLHKNFLIRLSITFNK